jgi:hypothetical protein
MHKLLITALIVFNVLYVDAVIYNNPTNIAVAHDAQVNYNNNVNYGQDDIGRFSTIGSCDPMLPGLCYTSVEMDIFIILDCSLMTITASEMLSATNGSLRIKAAHNFNFNGMPWAAYRAATGWTQTTITGANYPSNSTYIDSGVVIGGYITINVTAPMKEAAALNKTYFGIKLTSTAFSSFVDIYMGDIRYFDISKQPLFKLFW